MSKPCDNCGWTACEIECHLDRNARIEAILARHAPFEEGPPWAMAIKARARRTEARWFGRKTTLWPVAFTTDISPLFASFEADRTSAPRASVDMESVTYPYLWIDASKRLFSRQGRRRRFDLVPVDELADEDVERLEIGVQGNFALIEEAAEQTRTSTAMAVMAFLVGNAREAMGPGIFDTTTEPPME